MGKAGKVETFGKTKIIKKNLNPIWDERLTATYSNVFDGIATLAILVDWQCHMHRSPNPALASARSRFVTMEPGDLIFTGTPSGVGCFRNPQVWLKAGDVVECEIEGIGVISNPIV